MKSLQVHLLTAALVSMLYSCHGNTLTGASVDKRSQCADKRQGCMYWKSVGYCKEGNRFYSWVVKRCPLACGKCQPSREKPKPKPTWSLNRAEPVRVDRTKCLAAHNDKRKVHGARPLTWNNDLADQAEKWALELAQRNKFMHDPNNGNGENLYSSSMWGSTPTSATCEQAVKSWYSEVKDYPFNSPPYTLPRSPMIGHFTQIVWKATREVGVGIARIARVERGKTQYKTYIVARYSPPGNYRGKFRENV